MLPHHPLRERLEMSGVLLDNPADTTETGILVPLSDGRDGDGLVWGAAFEIEDA